MVLHVSKPLFAKKLLYIRRVFGRGQTIKLDKNSAKAPGIFFGRLDKHNTFAQFNAAPALKKLGCLLDEIAVSVHVPKLINSLHVGLFVHHLVQLCA